MFRMVGLGCVSAFLLLFANQHSSQFSRYKAVEAYEIRPGILMMPRYSADGKVCEIGLQKRLYSPDKITVDPTLSRDVIEQIADQLAPATERGQKITEVGAGGLILQSGNSMATNTEYENVSIRIYSDTSLSSERGGTVAEDLVATITWKHRKCE